MKSKFKLAAVSLALATAGLAQAAPTTLVPFAQTGASSTTITGTEVSGVTTIASAAWEQVTITGIAPNSFSNATPQTGYLSLNATSNNLASEFSTALTLNQLYDGSFQIYELAGGLGQNLLSGSFTNALVSGLIGGTALTFAASQLSAVVGGVLPTLSFTSSIFPSLIPPTAASFAFAAVNPIVAINNDSLASFAASFSGTNSAVIPEPATALLVGLGMIAAMTARRRRNKTAA